MFGVQKRRRASPFTKSMLQFGFAQRRKDERSDGDVKISIAERAVAASVNAFASSKCQRSTDVKASSCSTAAKLVVAKAHVALMRSSVGASIDLSC